MKNNRKMQIIPLIIACMGIGFALISSNMNSLVITTVRGNTWDIYFENIVVSSGSVAASLPTITDKTSVNYSATLNIPGDFYEFSIDCVNAGTLNAEIDSIEFESENIDDYNFIDYKILYEDGTQVKQGDIVDAGSTEKYIVRVEYKRDIDESDLLQSDIQDSFSLTFNYLKTKMSNYPPYTEILKTGTVGEKEFVIPHTGFYQLEVWGASGGSVFYNNKEYRGGYGGYSTGTVFLEQGQTIYVNVGGAGQGSSTSTPFPTGGYNGGGSVPVVGEAFTNRFVASGGGATHIALKSGLLRTLGNDKDKVLIVAGAGGGGYKHTETSGAYEGIGGDAGGYIGKNGQGVKTNNYYGLGGTQSAGGCAQNASSHCAGFGYGGDPGTGLHGSAGGAGWYGGGGSEARSGGANSSGAGGSSYIGNSALIDKVMYCYSCSVPSSNDPNYENIKTISTTNVSGNAISQYAKKGDGYAKITYLGSKNIMIDNFQKTTNSVEIENMNYHYGKKELSFATSLSNTEDYAEITFQVINRSNKNYYISEISKGEYEDTKINYTVSYANGDVVEENNFIGANSIQSITIKIQLTEEEYSIENQKFTFKMNYGAVKENGSYSRIKWEYGYEGKQAKLSVPLTGRYKLEVWGAQGGGTYQNYIGGYGGYSDGEIYLHSGQNLYVNVGGKGNSCSYGNGYSGGYNGGGGCGYYGTSGTTTSNGAGGGATHIATQSGLLSSLGNNRESILIVAGGGGGGSYTSATTDYAGVGGSGGGYKGNDASNYSNESYYGKGATQTSGGLKDNHNYATTGVFGSAGKTASNGTENTSGGGGGFYGGGSSGGASGGGSGYIGNTNLSNKAMYCFNCQEPDINDENYDNIKTVSTTNVSENPTSEYAKIGNGYAIITYLGE